MNGDVLLSIVVLIIRNTDSVGYKEKLQVINAWFYIYVQFECVVYQHHKSGQNGIENVQK